MDCSQRGKFHWKQDSPAEQAIVILQSIEGHVSNLAEGITTPEKCAANLQNPLEDLRALLQAALPHTWDGVKRQ